MMALEKSELLLRAIAMNGELPCEAAEYILRSRSYTAALITKLKKEDLISLRNKDGLKGYVLRSKGKKKLLTLAGTEGKDILSGEMENNRPRTDLQKRLRLHRMAYSFTYFYRMNVPVFPSDKPPFPPKRSDSKQSDYNDEKKLPERNGMAYFSASEVKAGSVQVKGSRACGMLFVHQTAYVVYHTMDQRMKWAKKMESSMRTYAETCLLANGYLGDVDAVMIGKDMRMMLTLLESDGGIKNDIYRPDDVYEHVYYFSMQDDGRAQMMVSLDGEIRERFRRFLMQPRHAGDTQRYPCADGFDEQGRPVYICCDLELRHLIWVKQEMEYKGAGKYICLDYQAGQLKIYFGEEAEALPLLPGKVLELVSGWR
ncbi:MAG: hypothetical protein LUI87_13660 [Lachnospiraceae bacterium]|nr:hypothetical protein [Lachnospiraceae bacterium]